MYYDMYGGSNFSGIGTAASDKNKAATTPKVLPPLAAHVAPPESELPNWLPYAFAGLGIAVVIGLLVTSKGKD